MDSRIAVLGAFLALFLTSISYVQAQSNGGAHPPVVRTSVLEDASVRTQAKQGLDLLYDMEFGKAQALFEQIDRRYPNHPIGPFLKALNTWWKILLDFSDTSHDEVFLAAMDAVITRSDHLLAQDPQHFDAMFFKGAALGFRGRLRANRRDWLKAATDGKRAMDYVLPVAEKDPANHDYAFGKGIYDYYADVLPNRYPFAKPVMALFPSGNRAVGLDLLERTASKGYFLQTEAAYFLLQIYYLFESDYEKSIEYVNWLRNRHPNNAFFHLIEGRIYARWGQWPRSAEIFSDILARFKQKRSGYNAAAAEQSLYYLALSDMRREKHVEAMGYLLQLEALAARTSQDTYFKVLGRLRQGMLYDLLNQRSVAQLRYRQVLAMKAWGNSQEQAKKYLDRPYSQ